MKICLSSTEFSSAVFPDRHIFISKFLILLLGNKNTWPEEQNQQKQHGKVWKKKSGETIVEWRINAKTDQKKIYIYICSTKMYVHEINVSRFGSWKKSLQKYRT